MPQPFKHSSGIYYVRVKLPIELWPVMGREYKKTLGTRDLAEAKRKFPQAMLLAQKAIEHGRARLAGVEVLSDHDIGQLAARWYRQEAARMDTRREFTKWLEGDTIYLEDGDGGEEVPVYRPLREFLEDDDDERRLSGLALRHAQSTLRDHALTMPGEGMAAWHKVHAAFREHVLKLSDLAYDRVQGQWIASNNVAAQAPLEVEQQLGRTQDGTGLLALFEQYAEEKLLNDGDNRGARKTLESYRSIVKQFIELCGDMPVDGIGRQTVQDYRALIVRLPARGEGIRALSAKQLLAKADAEALPRVSAATVRNKLLAMSAVFSYGVRMGLLKENPVQASGIGRAAKKAATTQMSRRVRRKYYNHAEIEQIFTSPIFASEWTAPRVDFGQAWYWMPLLMYYTGARREELAQLMVRDVQLKGEHSIPSLSILATQDEEADGRTLKTSGSRRVVPVHGDLVARGFLTYVEKLPKGGQLFPQLKPNPQGFFGANFGKHWGRYLKDVVGLTEDIPPSHGFRHTFKTLCREVGIDEDVHDAMTGHSGGSRVARGYGEMPLERMARELEKFPSAPQLRVQARALPPGIQPL